MVKKRFTAAARNRARPAARWGVYMLVGALLLLGAAGAAAQLLWASASPQPIESAAISPASLAGNGEAAYRRPEEGNGAQTLNLYGGRMRPLVEEKGGVQTLNIYGPGRQMISQVVRDGQDTEKVRYLLTDHLGSTWAVADAEGAAVARYEYAPYGETTLEGTAAAEVAYRYAGHRYDERQNVYETPARGYEPTAARFLSVDPQRQDASPYVYAGNNPVGYVDPTGGERVPFFVVSSMPVNSAKQGGALSRSIARGFGLRIDQSVYDSYLFQSRAGRSYATTERAPATVLFGQEEGQGAREWGYSDKLYWLIGKDTDVTVPDRIGPVLEAMRYELQRRGGPKFAQEIVLLDFTGDEKRGVPIMRKLLEMKESVRLVHAGIEHIQNAQHIPIAETLTHPKGRFTPDQFGGLVSKTKELDEAVPSNPGQSLEGDGMLATKKSKTSEPIDMSKFRELSTENEWWSVQYPMIREHRENMSVLDEVPAHVWPE